NFWISVSLWRPFASLNGRSLLVVNTERSSNDARLLSKPAGEILTAKQAPHRPGIAPVLGLRAGDGRRPHYKADRFSKGDAQMIRSSWFGGSGARRVQRKAWLEVLEDRNLLSFSSITGYGAGATGYTVALGDFNNDTRLGRKKTGHRSSSVTDTLGFRCAARLPAGAPVRRKIGLIREMHVSGAGWGGY